MNIAFRNDYSMNQMVIEDVKNFSFHDYSVRILMENRIDGLLRFDHETVNGRTDLLYDISSMDFFGRTYEYAKMGFEDLRNLILAINSVLRNLNAYLLDPDNIILKKECIFIDSRNGKYGFCYYPYYGGNLMLEIRELFSQILSLIDYDDRRAVRLAYDVQKASQTDRFTVESMVKTAGRIAAEKAEYEYGEEEVAYIAEPGILLPEETASLSTVGKTEPVETGFWKKAEMYFRDNEAGEIFDDINELKIFGKIRQYGYPETEAERPGNGKKRKEKETGQKKKRAEKAFKNKEKKGKKKKSEEAKEADPPKDIIDFEHDF